MEKFQPFDFLLSVARDRELTHVQVHILVAMVEHINNETGKLHISLQDIADKAACDRGVVTRAIKHPAVQKYLARVVRTGRNGVEVWFRLDITKSFTPKYVTLKDRGLGDRHEVWTNPATCDAPGESVLLGTAHDVPETAHVLLGTAPSSDYLATSSSDTSSDSSSELAVTITATGVVGGTPTPVRKRWNELTEEERVERQAEIARIRAEREKKASTFSEADYERTSFNDRSPAPSPSHYSEGASATEAEVDKGELLRAVLAHYGISVRAKQIKCPNPGHNDRNPSCSVDLEEGGFNCHSCGEHGNGYSVVMLQENLDFAGAVKFVKEKLNVKTGSSEPERTSGFGFKVKDRSTGEKFGYTGDRVHTKPQMQPKNNPSYTPAWRR